MQELLALVEKLRVERLTISTAESCTAGLLSFRLSSLAGASTYLQGGVVAYQDVLKASVLGVSTSSLAEYSAVSKQVAVEMAQGGQRIFCSDICVSTTGYAGPTAPEGMLGVVWVGIALPHGEVYAHELKLPGDRSSIVEQAVQEALGLVLRYLSR